MGEPTLWQRLRESLGSTIFDIYLWVTGRTLDEYRDDFRVCEREDCTIRLITPHEEWYKDGGDTIQ